MNTIGFVRIVLICVSCFVAASCKSTKHITENKIETNLSEEKTQSTSTTESQSVTNKKSSQNISINDSTNISVHIEETTYHENGTPAKKKITDIKCKSNKDEKIQTNEDVNDTVSENATHKSYRECKKENIIHAVNKKDSKTTALSIKDFAIHFLLVVFVISLLIFIKKKKI